MIKKLMMALVLMPMMALATTWYVNGSTGSDSNSGTSESAPKATIQAAVDMASAGDTILVAAGIYAPFLSDNMMITIQSIEGAGNTIIDGGGSYVRSNTLVVGCDNFANRTTNTVVQGFTIQKLTQILGGTIKNASSETTTVVQSGVLPAQVAL